MSDIDMFRRVIVLLLWTITCVSSLCGESARCDEPTHTSLLVGAPVVISPDRPWQSTINVAEPNRPLFLAMRIVLAKDIESHESACLMKLLVNDRLVSPPTAHVLNKSELYELKPGTKEDAWDKLALFDAHTGAWRICPRGLYGNLHYVTDAARSHTEEYVFRFDPPHAGNKLNIQIQSTGPGAIELSQIEIAFPRGPALVWAYPWMQALFPWQTPGPAELASDELVVTATPGESEPASAAVYALSDWPAVSATCSALKATDASGHGIDASHIRVIRIETFKRKGTGEATFVYRKQAPMIPDRWDGYSPELLIPMEESTVDIPAGQTQAFIVDFQIPPDQPAGEYRGTLHIAGADTSVELPIRLQVLPFQLACAPSRYWLWRLQWSPAWQQDNIACLYDIKAHGFDGLSRIAGVGLRCAIDSSGKITVDTSDYVKFAEILRGAGLAMQVRDDAMIKPLVEHAARYAIDQALAKPTAAGEPTHDVLQSWRKRMSKFEEVVPDLPSSLQQIIRPLVLDGLRQAKQAIQATGLEVWVFPVDEPDGTPWRRAWTQYAATLAKEAGFITWATRNNFSQWNPPLDYGAPGSMINNKYREPAIIRTPLTVDPNFRAIPWLGAMRDGHDYHFAGLIDDVRIYNRALTDEEMLAQHERSASEGLFAYYPCDAAAGGQTPDIASLKGNGHPLRITGNAAIVSGHIGNAVMLDGKDQHLEPQGENALIPGESAWSMSLWFKGEGHLFGRGYDYYHEGSRLILHDRQTGRLQCVELGLNPDGRFWQHLTLVVNRKENVIKAYAWDVETREWYRRNIQWNYMQTYSMPPMNPRGKLGVMAWFYAHMGNLKNITAFCYDLNQTGPYLVYPRNGQRFAPEGTVWYGTLGWLACREGIDDARYLQTLYEALLRRGADEEQAMKQIRDLMNPIIDPSYDDLKGVIDRFGGYDPMRQTLVRQLHKLQNNEGDSPPPSTK